MLFCGDLNTAHKEIDLARPQSNKKKSGFLPEERMWIDKVIEADYVDTFRCFHPDLCGQYTWWSYLPHSREQNIGWRYDYFFTAKEALGRVADAIILPQTRYSDHCPIGINLRREPDKLEVVTSRLRIGCGNA